MRVRSAVAIGLLFCAMSGAVLAQAWPSGPLRIVVPFQPGGSTDILGRAIAQRLGERVRQPVIVENRAGANGTIGAAYVAKSPAAVQRDITDRHPPGANSSSAGPDSWIR